MGELLRVTCGTNGSLYFIVPPKRDFVFYADRLEIYKKDKIVKTINYADIIEVTNAKTWQNNVFINTKPIGVMMYKVTEEDFNKIKEIIKK